MSFETIETPTARYIVFHEHHLREVRLHSQHVDGLVLEGVRPENASALDFYNAISMARPYRTIVPATNKIYTADISKKSKSTAQLFARIVLFGSLMPKIPSYFVFGGFVVGLATTFFSREMGPSEKVFHRVANKITQVVVGKKAMDFRDAIIAEKIEKLIAPKLGRELGRKPTIGIVYGSLHNVAGFLTNPTRRRRTLRAIPPKYRNNPEFSNFLEFTSEGNEVTCEIGSETLKAPIRPIRKRISARLRLARMKAKRVLRSKH